MAALRKKQAVKKMAAPKKKAPAKKTARAKSARRAPRKNPAARATYEVYYQLRPSRKTHKEHIDAVDDEAALGYVNSFMAAEKGVGFSLVALHRVVLDHRNVKKNPAPHNAAVEEAKKRFLEFRGASAKFMDTLKVPTMSAVQFEMGECLGIIYGTVRDGAYDKYIHRFKKKARPTLSVSSDGRSLYLLGGAYSVTDHGIVDDP